MFNLLLYVIIGILIFSYILDRVLNFLNGLKWSDTLPAGLEGIYDPEQYKKSMAYQRENRKFGFITGSFNLVIMLLLLLLGGFALVDGWARSIAEHPILIGLIFFGILGFAMDIIGTPFTLYDTFVIEEKFGFNKTTLKTFFLDKIKGWFLGLIIGGGLLSLVIWFYQLTGKLFWIYAWILFSLFMLFITMFYSTLIVPLFNKQTPLEEGELKSGIRTFCENAGFKLDNVFVIDGSKRSTKANAYFSGLGAKKRIVLFDTLINDLDQHEIIAVLAHEIGHYKKKHTVTGMVISIVQTGITLFILSLFIGSPLLSGALGSEIPSFHLGLVAFGMLYSPISTILGLGMNMLSRKNEFQADSFAKDHDSGEGLASALKKLSVKNLSNLTPHPVYVFFHYSHPPLLDRLNKLKEEGR
jgi:STE24 endopeptidase